jgi:hypothetical protein
MRANGWLFAFYRNGASSTWHLSIGVRSTSASAWFVDVILAGQESDQASTSLINIELCHILRIDATVFNNDGVTSVTDLLR